MRINLTFHSRSFSYFLSAEIVFWSIFYSFASDNLLLHDENGNYLCTGRTVYVLRVTRKCYISYVDCTFTPFNLRVSLLFPLNKDETNGWLHWVKRWGMNDFYILWFQSIQGSMICVEIWFIFNVLLKDFYSDCESSDNFCSFIHKKTFMNERTCHTCRRTGPNWTLLLRRTLLRFYLERTHGVNDENFNSFLQTTLDGFFRTGPALLPLNKIIFLNIGGGLKKSIFYSFPPSTRKYMQTNLKCMERTFLKHPSHY